MIDPVGGAVNQLDREGPKRLDAEGSADLVDDGHKRHFIYHLGAHGMDSLHFEIIKESELPRLHKATPSNFQCSSN